MGVELVRGIGYGDVLFVYECAIEWSASPHGKKLSVEHQSQSSVERATGFSLGIR